MRPRWYADDITFGNSAKLFLILNRYIFSMLYICPMARVSMECLGVSRIGCAPIK